MKKTLSVLVCIVVCCVLSTSGCFENENSDSDNLNKAIAEAISPVADGQGVFGTANYNKNPGTHPIVLIGISGEIHEWTNSMPEEWRPKSLSETELVVCVGNQTSKVIETCLYTGPSVTRYQYNRKIQLREAGTGTVIAETTLYGSMPPACRQTENYYITTLTGSEVSFNQLKDWLKRYVVIP